MIGDRLSALLLVLVTGFGALAVWGWQNAAVVPTPVVAAAAQSTPLVQASAPLSFAVPPLDELSQTVERPLFSQTRRPAPAQTVVDSRSLLPVKTAKLTPLAIELSAVILGSDRQYALFRKAAQKGLLRAEVGQSVDGWLVSEIRGDGVSLERGAERQALVLRTFKAPVRRAPVRKAPRRKPAGRTPRGRKKAGRTPRSREPRAANPAASPAAEVQRPRRPRRGPRRRSIQRQSPRPADQ